mgnify:CR=1 FL=1
MGATDFYCWRFKGGMTLNCPDVIKDPSADRGFRSLL